MKSIIALIAVLAAGHCLGQERMFEAASVRVASSGERYSPMSGGPETRDPVRVKFGTRPGVGSGVGFRSNGPGQI